jgi:hypothetical protein
VFVGGKVDQESKLLAKGNKAVGQVGAGNQGAVPSIEQKEYCLHCNPNQVLLVHHNFKSLVKIMNHALNQHRIVVIPDVSINLK